MKLWDFQEEAKNKLRDVVRRGYRRPLLVAPTGSGKTNIAADTIKTATGKGNRVLFLAPRRKLIKQAHDRLADFGIDSGMLMAGEPENIYSMVQVGSKDTINSRGINKGIRRYLPKAEVVIVDEAHLSLSPSWLAVLERYSDSVIIGMTATPARQDGKGLGQFYDCIVESASIKELTNNGYLVPTRCFAPSRPDLEGVKIVKGDYQLGGEHGLERKLEQNTWIIGDIYENWKRIAGNKVTVVFSVTCAHGRQILSEFKNRGERAEYIDGNSPKEEQAEVIKRVETGETQVLVNCQLLSYGVDIPKLECAVLAAPTKSVTRYLQAVGRVLRICPGKEEAIIIDHGGIIDELGLPDDDIPWSLNDDEKVKERKEREKEEKKEPKEIECSKCKAIFKSTRVCPECGHQVIPKGEPIPVYQADLKEVKGKEKKGDILSDKKSIYSQLEYIRRNNGYAPGWTAHKYREIFGVWPKNMKGLPAKPPTEHLKNWVLSQRIRYEKREEKANAAHFRSI